MPNVSDDERKWMRMYEKSLNRRAEVEEELFQMARGQRPLPTADDCRRLAQKLGDPDFRPVTENT